ncbi:MAG TPA: GDSL-type esterase/lipase family protein [Solirubrobacterales bacterium]|nr:GDSL-type esterase/lipase family protein [Solirubrobacterales bacterium]
MRHQSQWSAIALAMVIFAAVAAPAAGDEQPASTTLFEWSIAGDFGSKRDELGRIVESHPGEVKEGPWGVDLRVADAACGAAAVHRWSVDGEPIEPQPAGLCKFKYEFPREGSYTVRLEATVGAALLSQEQEVNVRDWLIVSVGDSVASGEAVPDVPDFGRAIWQSVRCHRSARAGPAQAAKLIEEDDRQSSVTFVHLACSGATIPRGLLGPYGGAEPVAGEPLLEAQVDELNRVAERREVDAVLLSVAANDIHFGDMVRFCAAVPNRNCFEEPLPRQFGGDGVRKAGDVISDSLETLDDRYAELDAAISSRIPRSRIHIVEYFDPTHGADGQRCKRLLGFASTPEPELAESRMLKPLNKAVAAAAERHGWNLVSGVSAAYHQHGYCAGKRAWVTTLTRSATSLGGTIAGRFLGTLHPNQAGHEATAALIAASLERQFFPGRAFPARPDPPPAEDEGLPGAAIVAGALAAVVFAMANLWLIPFALSAVLVAAILAGLYSLWGLTGMPILLGILAALLLLIRRPLPLSYLARTIRPLFLPFFVLAAVGSVKLGPLGQFLISGLAALLAWRLIIAPSAAEANLELHWERALVKRVTTHGLLAILAGGLAAAVLVELTLGDSTYFETVGDVASGLLLAALLLWVAAIGLRLLSYATSRLRLMTALATGLMLAFLGMAFGVLPGDANPDETVPAIVTILATIVLGLLLIEATLDVLAADEEGAAPAAGIRGLVLKLREGGLPKRLTTHVRALGFTAAAAAAVVLATSTVWGLVAAGERGDPLVPPESASIEAPTPAAGFRNSATIELVQRYAPVLAFTEDERWSPIRVEDYLADATLSGGGQDDVESPTLEQLPRSCPDSGESNCYQLSIGCESGQDPCAGQAPARDPEHDPKVPYRDGAVYVRVLEKEQLTPGRALATFPERGPFHQRLSVLLQYWYFYYYDEWRAPVFAGLLNQQHEGDWEVVSIGLDAARRPLFVADSAHCAGSWRRWEKVEVSTALGRPYLHPLVGVAEGSHANYPDPNQKRSPDWAHCQGAPAGATTAISFASNIRDKTGFGWLWYPPDDGWVLVGAGKPPMSFPGAWGASDRTTLENFNSHLLGESHGPFTPTLQGSWLRPVTTIFCGKYTPPSCEGGV